MIDFFSKENEFLIDDRVKKKEELINELKKINIEGHIFILSSGSTALSELKGFALSKEAILANAKSVIRHLNLVNEDIFLLSIPKEHIGGLSILARANILGAKIISFKKNWNYQEFKNLAHKSTICSLVPTQCHMIIEDQFYCPQNMRYAFVGGDYLPSSMHDLLLKLNWPILRTFGMTETCSQIATEKKPSKKSALEVLDIYELSKSLENVLIIKSPSLFSACFTYNDKLIFNPRVDDHFTSSDLISFDEYGHLIPIKRLGAEIKINGRRLDFQSLRQSFLDLSSEYNYYGKVNLKLLSHDNGYKLVLEHSCPLSHNFLDTLELLLKPFKIDHMAYVDVVDLTLSGKLKSI